MASPAALVVNLAEEESENDLDDHLVGSGEYQIVGIRYYAGVAHPGEYVVLVREPRNPYDRNAIRVDNLRGEKVGHVKATMAKHLAAVMDNHPGVRAEGTIPRGGNSFNLPLLLEFYIADATEERARMEARNLSSKLRSDHSFRLTPEFGGSGDTAAATASKSKSIPVVNVVTKKLDWCAQQAALDKMFDVALTEKYTDLPNITMPACLSKNISLFDYQIKGVQWLVKRETEATPAPFYTKVNENGRSMYLCEITNSSQATPPTPILGSILADEMGLGKSIQTVALILLAPPAGIVYDAPQAQITDADVPVKPSSLIPTVNKRCTLIVCPVSVLGNWTDQISTFVSPGVLKVELYHGTNRHAVLSDVNSGNVDVLLVSYNTLAADYDGSSEAEEAGLKKKKKKRARMEAMSIFEIEFHRVVLDEAHMIRNSKTRSFKAVSLIKAERKLVLTGTPLVNSSGDIFSLLSFLGVEPLNDKSIFTRSITQPIKNGDEIGLTRLRTTMGFLSLRRSKQNSGVKLVDKDVQLCSVKWMDDAHKRVYDALFGTVRCAMEAILGNVNDDSKALKNYSVIFEKLLRLRQACCSGLLLTKERHDLAIEIWDGMKGSKEKMKLSAEEGLALLEKLKGAFSEATDSLPECGICLMEMEEADGIVLAKCRHVFCKLCIRQVLSKSGRKCPYCRASFDESDVVDMAQATKASSEKISEEKPADNIFGTPPKILALLQAIESMKEDEKGVIFSQFTLHLDVIGEAMTAAGHSFLRIDGSVPAPKRISTISSFNSNDAGTPRFILCSLLASGTGINLTRANWCFMMDVWWNEAVESQAMDRIHRISQSRKVHVLRFVMKDSIEERIIHVQERKSLQAKGALQRLSGEEKRKALLGDLRGLLEITEE